MSIRLEESGVQNPHPPARPGFWTAVARGWRKRCPRCGEGVLFSKGSRLRERCDACGLQYQRNRGDHWAFLLVVDRAVFVLPLIALIYFDLLPGSGAALAGLFAGFVGLFIATNARRYGLCIGLDYYARRWWGEADEDLSE